MSAARRAYDTVAQLHEHPELVAWAQTPIARLLIFVLAAVLLRPFELARLMIPALALVMLWPHRRRVILALGAVASALTFVGTRARTELDLAGARVPVMAILVVLVVLGALYAVYLAALRFSALPLFVRRRPQVWLHASLWSILAVAWMMPDGLANRGLALVVFALPFVIWRAGYVLMSGQRGRAAGTRFQDHLFCLWPVYGGSNTPLGKGHDYLSRHEAGTSEAFARAQLGGLKLLILALLWRAALVVMGGLVYGDPDNRLARLAGGTGLGIPRLETLVGGEVAVARPVAWLALYVELVRVTLDIAVSGHVVVGSLRLLGFNVFRNTYKPLLATTIVDFWNRFYYYFKELLVDFFFFPTYLRWFRRHARLRILAATLAAAGLGNLYYHLLQRHGFLLTADLAGLWPWLSTRALYCLLLALGIYVSMLREQRRRGTTAPPAGLATRVRRVAGVWTFFALLSVWSEGSAPFGRRLEFLLALFGLR